MIFQYLINSKLLVQLSRPSTTYINNKASSPTLKYRRTANNLRVSVQKGGISHKGTVELSNTDVGLIDGTPTGPSQVNRRTRPQHKSLHLPPHCVHMVLIETELRCQLKELSHRYGYLHTEVGLRDGAQLGILFSERSNLNHGVSRTKSCSFQKAIVSSQCRGTIPTAERYIAQGKHFSAYYHRYDDHWAVAQWGFGGRSVGIERGARALSFGDRFEVYAAARAPAFVNTEYVTVSLLITAETAMRIAAEATER